MIILREVKTRSCTLVSVSFILSGFLFVSCKIKPTDIDHAAPDSMEWEIISPNFSGYENCMIEDGTFVDSLQGWCVTHGPEAVWHTVDGGLNWSIQKLFEGTWLYHVIFVDALHGWVNGEDNGKFESILYRTTDGGESWIRGDTPTYYTIAIHFVSQSVGFVAHSQIYRTTDGGVSWDTVSVEDIGYFGLFDLHFSDDQNGWAVGSKSRSGPGVVLSSSDGGENWHIKREEGDCALVVHTDNSIDVCVACLSPGGPSILITHDGGDTWDSVSVPETLHGIYLLGDGTGWATGNSGLLMQTTDKGNTWSEVDIPVDCSLGSIVFVEEDRVAFIFGKHNRTLLHGRR
ncbi:hypothetical protein CH333_08455 [candidate division WOR-3 bacterium JGI_Cruoil_03_44_89]|uniref:Photosynthesis system II assembly factor Ycf48/Hcf136-like domain-containing protein n=1 Tax=candidate division WOR-3 bacterium JGI_Cruoil_03_44_89 TaxID=1973748 RepID=A0A235BPY5_UNCW3|nr:MAG: hypothetical protein CH333_08455 [candidate division WOR-3 bacterium JGI_Cruoil_03_44_89]